jgi:hypothetical protein
MLPTPVTYESFTYLRTKIEQNTALDSPGTYRIQKLANATEKLFTDRAILLDENASLFEHNNEKTTRQSVRSTMVGKARIMSYEAIVEAEQKRAARGAVAPGTKRGRRGLQKSSIGERSSAEEMELDQETSRLFRLLGNIRAIHPFIEIRPSSNKDITF